VTRVELAPEVLDDFDRFIAHLSAHEVPDAAERMDDVLDALQVLRRNPLIGRDAGGGKRELVIGKDARGYVALYRYIPAADTVFVLAIRGQREVGFKR
jgi:plasmid stabilization system protein ParE